ncbi:HAD family phosphatase [Candidatus Bathyarchaeota archaeon]|nr:HAD family phosphatase [Candidatus Bathyarchaeota archaeon]
MQKKSIEKLSILQVRAIIFDLDGTLIDSYQAHVESFLRALSRFGLTIENKEIHRRFGKPAKQIIKEILPENQHRHIDEIVRYKRLEFIETSKNMQVFDGVETLLKHLKDKGFRTCLATSADRPSVIRVLNKFDLENYFDMVISSNDVKEAKPNPEMFIQASKRLEVEPKNCLVIGDSPFDVIAAKKAKMNVIIVDNNPFQKTEILSHKVPIVSNINQLTNFF